MTMVRAVVSVAAIALLIQLAIAADYTVGQPNGGWDLTTPLQAWANSQTFFVGDTITFVYTLNHDVLEVSKPDYDACLGNNSVLSSSGGNTVITLASIGNRYFICGTPGHCDRGMKVVITTLAAPPPPEATPSVPPSATPSVPPPATPSEQSPATPSGSPTATPATSPVSSPSPKTGASPVQSPTKAPKSSPSASPSKSPTRSPTRSPSISPVSSPTALPPLPSDSSPSTTPSSASKVHVVAGLKMGLGLIMMMLLIQ